MNIFLLQSTPIYFDFTTVGESSVHPSAGSHGNKLSGVRAKLKRNYFIGDSICEGCHFVPRVLAVGTGRSLANGAIHDIQKVGKSQSH